MSMPFRTGVRSRAAQRVVSCGLAGLGLLAICIGSFGSTFNVVRVEGSSMEPTISSGDLVILAARDRYEVGDVVAFRAGNLGGAVVLHRIIRHRGDRYILQGDNNRFIDDYRPTAQEIIGRHLTHLPGGATWFERLAASQTTLITVATAIGLAMSIRQSPPMRRRAALRLPIEGGVMP